MNYAWIYKASLGENTTSNSKNMNPYLSLNLVSISKQVVKKIS